VANVAIAALQVTHQWLYRIQTDRQITTLLPSSILYPHAIRTI